MNGWTEIEEVGWAAIGASKEALGELALVPCTVAIGCPPPGYVPALTDFFLTPKRRIEAYTGEPWPKGSKFLLPVNMQTAAREWMAGRKGP